MATKKTSKLKTFLADNFPEFNPQVDSERLTALYSDFSKLFVLNQYAYDTNVNFWRRVILDVNLEGYLGSSDYAIAIEKEAIADKFQRPVIGRPLSLDCVIDTMLTQGELISLEEYNQRYAPPSTWLGWVYNTVVKNAWQWRWKYDYTVKQNTHYIVLPTVKALCKAIMTHHYQSTADPILTLTQFKSLYASHFVNEIELTENDIALLLRYLHSQHGVGLAENVKGYGTSYMVIKFPSREGEIATITQHDEAVVSIRTTCHALSVQVDELQRKSEELHKQSIEEKRLGHTSKALYCLKRKKNLQEVLERRLKSMETMDTVLMKIETSKDDLQVVQAFNLGADALKGLLGADGLTLESVDEAMEKIQNALEDQKEIEDAIQLGNNEISGYNDDEMEDELSQLIEEEARVSSPPLPQSSKPEPEQQQNVNSELSRLNQMFSSVKNVPTHTNTDTTTSKKNEKQREYA